MNRLVLILVIFPAVLLTAMGGVYFLLPESGSAGEESRPQAQYGQLLPWATEEKRAPVRKAPAAPVPEEDSKAPQTAGPGWAVNCSSNAGEKGLSCRLSQTVVAKQGGRTLTNVEFLLPPENKNPELVLQLPLGLYLPAGASYQVDGNAPQRLSIRACDHNGCYAKAPVSPETWGALGKGKQLKVNFMTLDEEPVTLALSLDGFASAYEKIQTP